MTSKLRPMHLPNWTTRMGNEQDLLRKLFISVIFTQNRFYIQKKQKLRHPCIKPQ
ncbi:hypothetical protein M5D96_004902, partial [Drosophila gunungcola]